MSRSNDESILHNNNKVQEINKIETIYNKQIYGGSPLMHGLHVLTIRMEREENTRNI